MRSFHEVFLLTLPKLVVIGLGSIGQTACACSSAPSSDAACATVSRRGGGGTYGLRSPAPLPGPARNMPSSPTPRKISACRFASRTSRRAGFRRKPVLVEKTDFSQTAGAIPTTVASLVVDKICGFHAVDDRLRPIDCAGDPRSRSAGLLRTGYSGLRGRGRDHSRERPRRQLRPAAALLRDS